MKNFLIGRHIEGQGYVPLLNNVIPVGSVLQKYESFNNVGSKEVDLDKFFSYITEEENLVSKEFTKEMVNLLQSENIPFTYIVVLVEASLLLSEDLTFQMNREGLENLFSAYTTLYPNPYIRFLEVAFEPHYLKRITAEETVRFTNSYTEFLSMDKQDTYEEFTVNPQDMVVVSKKQSTGITLEEMNRNIMKNKGGTSNEISPKQTEPVQSEEQVFSLNEEKEGEPLNSNKEPVEVKQTESIIESDDVTMSEKATIPVAPAPTDLNFGQEEILEEELIQEVSVGQGEINHPVDAEITAVPNPVDNLTKLTQAKKLAELIDKSQAVTVEDIKGTLVSVEVYEEPVENLFRKPLVEEPIEEAPLAEEVIEKEPVAEDLIEEEPVEEESVTEETVKPASSLFQANQGGTMMHAKAENILDKAKANKSSDNIKISTDPTPAVNPIISADVKTAVTALEELNTAQAETVATTVDSDSEPNPTPISVSLPEDIPTPESVSKLIKVDIPVIEPVPTPSLSIAVTGKPELPEIPVEIGKETSESKVILNQVKSPSAEANGQDKTITDLMDTAKEQPNYKEMEEVIRDLSYRWDELLNNAKDRHKKEIIAIKANHEVDILRAKLAVEESQQQVIDSLNSQIKELTQQLKTLEGSKSNDAKVIEMSNQLKQLQSKYDIDTNELFEKNRSLLEEVNSLMSQLGNKNAKEEINRVREYVPARTVGQVEEVRKYAKSLINAEQQGNISVSEFYRIKQEDKIPRHGVTGVIIKPTKG